MQHKLSTDVQQYANRRRRKKRNRLLGCVAGILVFCITYAALLPAISQAAPYISEAVKTLVAPTYEYNPSDKYTSYTYSDNDIDVVVQLPADSNVPKDAILRVTPIKETHAEYASLASKAEKAVNGAVKQAQFYDISFFTEQMEYIPVDDRAKVSINYSAPTMDVDSDIVVLHYDENDDNPITLDKTDFTEEPYTCEQELTFETDGFSVFAVVELTTMYQTVEGITGLEDKSYIIAAVNNNDGKNADGTPNVLPVMTSVAADNNTRLEKRLADSFVYSDNKVTSVALTDYTNAVWTFEKAGTDTYYIKSSRGQYLSIPNTEKLTLTNEKQELRVVAATVGNGQVTNAVCIETVEDGTPYRVVLAENKVNNNFTSYTHDIDNSETHLVLVEYIEPQTPALTDLAGKSYIIAGVNFADNYKNDVLPVLTSNIDPENPKHLASRLTEKVVFQDDQVISVALSNYADAVWTFENAGEGTYYIKNSKGGYLSIPENTHLQVGNTQQKFKVVAAAPDSFEDGDATNAVCIQVVDNDGRYVNISGNYPYDVYDNDKNRGDFTGYKGTNSAETGERGNHLVLIEYKEHQVTMPVITPAISDDGVVNNLAGKKIVITNVRYKEALTGTAVDADYDQSYDHLAGKNVTIANGQSTVTISSENSADLVWEFVDAGTPGRYYIKHVATGKYLHIYDDYQKGNKPLTLEQTDTPQAIQVLSAKNDQNPNAVWFIYPVFLYTEDGDDNTNRDYNAIDYYDGGFAVWNKSSADDQNRFLLSEYTDLPMMDAVDRTVSANNLNGKTMVITAANYNAVMSNNDTTIGGRGMLEAQATEKKGDVLGVASDTKLKDVSWTFTSVPNGQANQYYIQDSTGNYLNINGTSVDLSAENKQPISVYENNDGTFVLYVNQTDQDYLLDYGWNDNAFSAWGRKHDEAEGNNKFNLTPVEQFNQDSPLVTNLDGKTLAIVSIYDANWNQNDGYTTPQLAVTSRNDYFEWNGLKGVQVTMNPGTNGKAYTFDDTVFTNNEELWTFEAVDNKPGVYYIKAVNTDNGQYLNLGNGTATVSANAQEITVLTNTFKGIDGITYEGVYLRATVDGKEVYLRRELNGHGDKLFGDDDLDLDENGAKISERNFVLAQPSMFYIDVEKEGLNENTEDWLFKPHFGDDWNSTKQEVTFKTNGTLPTSGELGAEPEENLQGTSTTRHFVSFNFAESWDDYTAGKGRDFPQAYMASWAQALDQNGDGYISAKERGDTNGDGYVFESEKEIPDNLKEKVEVDNAEEVAEIKARFIQTLKANVYDEDFQGESPYWGVEYELTHYEVILPDGSTLKDNNGNVVRFAPGTEYSVNENGKIAIKDVNGVDCEVPYGSTFKAQYREFSDILTFYINLYGVVEDTEGDIQPRYIEDFTLGLAIAHIYNPQQYAGATGNDYDNANEHINSLFKGAYGVDVAEGEIHAVIDGFITRKDTNDVVSEEEYIPEYRDSVHVNDQNIYRYLSNPMNPALGATATELAAHVLDYIRKVPDIDIMLKQYVSGNGENQPTLNRNTIDTASFDVRWYVVKDQGDSWHIDGVTIGRSKPIVVTKTFYGLDTNDETQLMLYERENVNGENDYTDTQNFQIQVSIQNSEDEFNPYYNMQPYDSDDLVKKFPVGDKTYTDPNLKPVSDKLYSYVSDESPYNWSMSAILRQIYELKEKKYEVNGYVCVSRVKVKDVDGETINDYGISATVIGGTTASVEFNNYYTKTNTGMFVIKKVDTVVGQPVAGAEFTLFDIYGNEIKDSNDNVIKAITDASGEAFFNNLELGTYILKETKAPEGFADPDVNKTWTIEVDVTGKVTGREKGSDKTDLLYPVIEYDGTTTFNPLEITNEPNKRAVLVVKEFKGITPAQVPANYQITIKGINDEDVEVEKILQLTETKTAPAPTVSADGLTYYWILTDMVGEYTVTESNYELPNMLTSITVQQLDELDEDKLDEDKLDELDEGGYRPLNGPLTFDKDDAGKETATFNITFTDTSPDSFKIQNSYSNDFSIKINKVDSTGDQNPLSGAIFDVYGDFYIATQTQKWITVNDKVLYYLGTAATTDQDGVATFNGWTDDAGVFHKLVLGWPYALVETKAPDGYNLLTQPIYLGTITSEGVTYNDKTLKDWPDSTYPISTYPISFHNGVYSITVPNEPGYELPETGGAGTQFYTLGGLLLMAVPLMYGYKRKRAWKGGEMA